MKLITDIPDDVYTRLFDNGIQDNEIATDDICEMARALRLGKPLPHCEDVVSRDLMTNTLGATCIAKRDEKGDLVALCSIDHLPPITPQPKTGHWIYDRTRDWDGECKYECSECGMGSDVDYAYCMRCGAKMQEVKE